MCSKARLEMETHKRTSERQSWQRAMHYTNHICNNICAARLEKDMKYWSLWKQMTHLCRQRATRARVTSNAAQSENKDLSITTSRSLADVRRALWLQKFPRWTESFRSRSLQLKASYNDQRLRGVSSWTTKLAMGKREANLLAAARQKTRRGRAEGRSRAKVCTALRAFPCIASILGGFPLDLSANCASWMRRAIMRNISRKVELNGINIVQYSSYANI